MDDITESAIKELVGVLYAKFDTQEWLKKYRIVDRAQYAQDMRIYDALYNVLSDMPTSIEDMVPELREIREENGKRLAAEAGITVCPSCEEDCTLDYGYENCVSCSECECYYDYGKKYWYANTRRTTPEKLRKAYLGE